MATKLVTANLPGFLHGVIERRWQALGYAGKSEYVAALVVWDIYSHQTHNVTGSLMKEPSWVMEKFVRGLVHDLGEPDPPAGDIIAHRFSAYVPATLMPIVKIRAKEEGYRSASAYIVALVIYDLKQRDDPKKVPHHKTAEVMRMPDADRIRFYGALAKDFGNPERKWPKHLLPQ